MQKKSREIITWISKTVHSAGFSRVVLGLSGGIDSALSATLAVKALGRENVYVVLLPCGAMSNRHITDAQQVAQWLDIPESNRQIIDIKEAIDVVWKSVRQEKKELEVRQGNIMARVRMIYLFDLAKQLSALVCGTENKTEHYLGYFTRFGDSASDLEPIRSLYKTQVWEMAKYLDIPEQIITKTPTAGLWENQTDEGELGFTYKEADAVLFSYFDKKFSEEKIIAKGIKKEIVESVLQRVKLNAFKHTLPLLIDK